MRVGIIAIQHESNTFLDRPTTIDDFRRDVFLTGDAIREKYSPAHHEVGGFFQGLAEADIQAVPILHTRAIPSGVITAECCDELVEHTLRELARAGDLEGLLVAPHGAAVSAVHRDFDGHWLSILRKTVGPRMPMICTLDLHANVSRRMVDACNATIAYRTNPHLDQRARGIEAAKLIARTLRCEVKPTQAGAFPPIQINIERQHTTESPCRELYGFADEMLNRPGVLANSVVLGFPYADVAEMGSTTIVTTDNDPALAQKLADELAQYILDYRTDFLGQSVPVEQAIDDAIATPGPVCLLDMGDNVGGGSPGDGTIIAHAIHRREVRGFVCLNDPEAAQIAINTGAGQRANLKMGAKADARHGEPLQASVTVRSIHDGKYSDHTPRHGGSVDFNMGPSAVVQTETGLTILLTSRRTPPFSLGMMTSCDLDPKNFQVIVAKGVHAPVAAYRSVCTRFIRVDTPGITTANMGLLEYRHRRKPLYPLEEI